MEKIYKKGKEDKAHFPEAYATWAEMRASTWIIQNLDKMDLFAEIFERNCCNIVLCSVE